MTWWTPLPAEEEEWGVLRSTNDLLSCVIQACGSLSSGKQHFIMSHQACIYTFVLCLNSNHRCVKHDASLCRVDPIQQVHSRVTVTVTEEIPRCPKHFLYGSMHSNTTTNISFSWVWHACFNLDGNVSFSIHPWVQFDTALVSRNTSDAVQHDTHWCIEIPPREARNSVYWCARACY